MEIVQAQKKIDQIQNESERNVANLLLNIGFTFEDSNSIITNSSDQRIGEIDLIFTFKDYLFLVEVSKDKHSSNKKSAFFNKWDDRDNLAIVNKQYQLRPRKVMRVYFDLSTKTPENPSAEILRITKSGKLNKVAYLDDYEYFLNCHRKIGLWAKNDFLDWLEYEDEKTSKQIDAIQYYIDDVPVFCFVERVYHLLHTCYVSRRRTKDMGYQRTLKEHRMINISNNIKKREGLSFPNSILINVPDMTDNILPPEKCPKVVKIQFPLSYNTCRIIDGQHRLLGFSGVSSEIQKMYSMPVIALQDYGRKKEIKTFVDINSKQQRIDGNLILLLKADLEWKEGTIEFKQKIAVGVADELNRSFFKNRIYFGMADEPKGKKITLTTLVSSMVSNDLVQETISLTNKKLKEIFSYMQQHMPDYSFKEDTYFGQNRGISVLFRLINLLQRNMHTQKMNVSKEIFFQDLSKVFNKKIIENLDNYYGEGGANAAATLLITELKKAHPIKYGRMETNLNLLRVNKK
jgi:DGQHR domain-containing protein